MFVAVVVVVVPVILLVAVMVVLLCVHPTRGLQSYSGVFARINPGKICGRAEAAVRLGVSERLPTALRHQGLLRSTVRAHHLAASHLQRGSISRR